jgi:amidase
LGKPVSALRVGVWSTDALCPSSTDVKARVEAVAQALANAGAQVNAAARPAFDAAHSHAVYVSLLHAAMASRAPRAAYDKLVAQANALAADDTSERARVLRAQTARVHDWAPLNEARAGLRWAWHDFFKDFDFMVTPIMPTSAFPHDHGNFGGRRIQIDGQAFPYFDQTLWAGMVGVAMLPATIIPTGPDANGLPIGVQIIGPMMGDLQTIQLAQFLERQGFAFTPPPACL